MLNKFSLFKKGKDSKRVYYHISYLKLLILAVFYQKKAQRLLHKFPTSDMKFFLLILCKFVQLIKINQINTAKRSTQLKVFISTEFS